MVTASTARDASERHQGRRATKGQRIAVRVTEELQERVAEAAAMTGRTLSEFVTEAIQEKADSVILDFYTLQLTERDMAALMEAVENPPAPNEAMHRAIARRKGLIAPRTTS